MNLTRERIYSIFRISVVCALVLYLLFGARSAYGVTVVDMMKYGPLDFLATFLVELIVSAIQDVISPLTQVLFNWSTDFMTIPFVNTVILGLQGVAVFAVIIIRVYIGFSQGIFLKGGSREQSAGEYVYKTILSLIIVALMPTICRLVIQFGNTLYGDITSQGGSIADSLAWFTIDDNLKIDGISFADSGAVLWMYVGVFAIMVLCIACGYQFVRRQIEMLVVSIIGPLVSIYAATENDDSQPLDLLKNLFGLVCQQWLQYLLVQIALGFGISWISGAITNSTGEAAFWGENAQMFLFCLATFGAALTIPSLVDRYTFSSGGSRVGSVAVGAVVSKAVRGPRMPKAPGIRK